MKRKIAIAVLTFLVLSGITAQTIETDEDSLFGTTGTGESEGLFQDDTLVIDVEETEEDLGTILLTSDGVDIGGDFRFTTSSAWKYDGHEGPFGASLTDSPLTIDLGVSVYMDARPSETFRVFGKVDLSHPFSDDGGTRNFDEIFHVAELFSDFQIEDTVFFRAGKQTINWGVGYFFSPADLLNITEIDPEDPEAEQEGPVALKIHSPLGNHNLYLYIVPEDADRIEETAIAPKVEFVAGGTEIAFGAFYRSDLAPAAMATVTTSLLDFDIFAEGVLSYGSNKTFVVEDTAAPLGVGVETYDERLFPSVTLGFSYGWSDDLDNFIFNLNAQYLYNGEGYEDPDFLVTNAPGIGLLLDSGDIAKSDLVNPGTHYAAARGSWNSMLNTDISLGFLWIGNLSDGSGSAAPSISINAWEDMDISFTTAFRYGDPGDEYTPSGETLIMTLAINNGGGKF
jgi:hypothetical protein